MVFVHFTDSPRVGLEQCCQYFEARTPGPQTHKVECCAPVRVSHRAALWIVAQRHFNHIRRERRVSAEIMDTRAVGVVLDADAARKASEHRVEGFGRDVWIATKQGDRQSAGLGFDCAGGAAIKGLQDSKPKLNRRRRRRRRG